MFGVFSRFLGHLWEGVFPEEKDGATESNEEVLAKNGRQRGCETQRGNFGSSVASHELRKCFSGKVTKVYDDSGMIDEEVFFKFNQVIGGIRPKLGAEVYGEAWRESADDGWRATRVEVVMSEWNSFGEEGTREVLIGEVTGITEENIIVNVDVYCKVSSLTVGYVACKGDWVRVELLRDRGVVCEVESVRPLREKTETAYITSVTHGHGYINTDIFFSFGACKKSYVPRKGHTVQVTAIESNQGNCKWRALRVEPKIPRQKLSNLNLLRTIANQESKFTKELLCDKQGVTITDQVNFGDVTVGETQKRLVCIRNNGANMVILKCVEGLAQDSIFWIEPMGKENLVCSDNTECETAGSSMKQALNIEITPQNMLELNITVSSRFLGEMNQLVVFNFGTFQIGRYFIANVQDAQQQLLNVRVPFHRQKFVDQKNALTRVLDTRNNQQWVIPGDRPMFKQPTIINISCKLRQYEIPRILRQYILDKMDLCCLVPSLGEPLLMRNYKERFSALLHAEEVQMELEMREFDMEQVSLNDAGELLSLSVPGLAEGRPSLLIGDRVILSVSAASQNCPKYEGFIHEVLNDAILLKFHDDFHTTYDMDCYDVMFFFNRAPLRRAHRAIEMAKYLGDQVLFPTRVVPALPQILCKSKAKNGLYNEKLNERQKAAVSRILSGQCRPMPYVLFGPPGTGKTVTLVEAILQVFHHISFSRILACTPSNSAADLIVQAAERASSSKFHWHGSLLNPSTTASVSPAQTTACTYPSELAERLHHSSGIGEGDMVRLNAFQRQQNIPEDIENYSANIEKLDMAAHYRIVICTCTTAGQLHTLGLPTGHFTHVFIDEAGQATEPESLVPISFLAGTDGQIILGGDPYQLGAVLRSEISQSYGLDISLLERLMNCYPYQRDEEKFSDHGCYDPLTVTKLINNYRSHEALLELPSRLFYHAEMVPCVEESVKNCLCDWKSLPNKKGFPIIFHGVKGEDLREGNSPSWFNAVEAVQVIRYVQELRSFKKHEVKLTDIGIITPYRKQVEKIRLLLERLGLNEIKVGSVEEFQGQERLVIIISTVRSRSSLLGLDVAHNLGFLSNPKRFNVAITRAQALMILIGNPHILSKDVNWRALLKYCVDNNGYIGCDLPRLDEVVEDAYGESVDMEGHDGLSDSNDEPSRPDVDSLHSVPNQFLANVGNTRSLCDDGKEAEWLNRSNYNAADRQKKNVVRKTRSEVEDKSFAYEIRGEPARDSLDQEGKFVTNTTFVDNRETKGDYVRDYSMYKTRDMKVNSEWQVSGKEDVSETTHEKTTRLVLHNAKRTSSTSLNRQRMTADENIDFNQETAIPTLPKATRTDSIQDPINHSSDEDLEEIVYIPDPQR